MISIKEIRSLNTIIQETKRLFMELHQMEDYESVGGFSTEDGKLVCIFWNEKRQRNCQVYLKNGILYPYFKEN